MPAPVSGLTYVKDLRLFFENLIDDQPEYEATYQKLSNAKNRIEVENDLEVLVKDDTSRTAAVGQDYQTEWALPDDWRKTKKLYVANRQYFPVGYSRRIDFRNTPRRFFINAKDRTFGLTGIIATPGTVRHSYIIKSDDFVVGNEDTLELADVLMWPVEFAPIIAYEAAGFYQQGEDHDSIATPQGQVHLAHADSLMQAFLAWDQDLKLGNIGDRLGYADDETEEVLDIGSLGA